MLPVEQYMLGINAEALRVLQLDSDILLGHLWEVAACLPVEPGDEAETIRQCDQINDLLGAVYEYRPALFARRGVASLADFASYKRLFAAEDFFGLLGAELDGGSSYESLWYRPLGQLSEANFELLGGLCEAKFLLPAQILGAIAVYRATDEFHKLPHRPKLRLVVDNLSAPRQPGVAQLTCV